jgi:hypothetical protein
MHRWEILSNARIKASGEIAEKQSSQQTCRFDHLIRCINELTFLFGKEPPAHMKYFPNLERVVGRRQDCDARLFAILHGLKVCIDVGDDALHLGAVKSRHARCS